MQPAHQRLALRVSLYTIAVNVLLSAFKLFAGIAAGSGAMISDAAHSASDVLTTLVVIAGVRLAGRAADADHPFGHERLESVAALILAGLLGLTGLGIGWMGVRALLRPAGDLAAPGALALWAAVVSMAVKEGMFWYTRAAARKVRSSALMADAWHHRSDALSSVGSFVGILGARLGFPALDPVASLVICLFILKAALDVFRDAVSKLTDRACPGGMEADIRATALAQPGVLAVDGLRTRLFGDRAYVEIEIAADGAGTLDAAHDAAERVHRAVEAGFPMVKHCMVHVNPGGREK